MLVPGGGYVLFISIQSRRMRLLAMTRPITVAPMTARQWGQRGKLAGHSR